MVVISPDALSPYSLSHELGDHADVMLLNTIICAPLLRRRTRAPRAWFIHESHVITALAAAGTDVAERQILGGGIHIGNRAG